MPNASRTGFAALRSISRAWAASASGVLMQHVAFSAPLFLGGSMKVLYDLLLYRSFRHIRPPEEK